MATLRVNIPEGSPAEIDLAPGCYRVGREGDVEVAVPHASVSRTHCEVLVSEASIFVRDLGSRNGTYLDGQKIHEAHWAAGQTLQLGDVSVQLASPTRISVPDLPMPAAPKQQLFFEDGTPCCFHHDSLVASVQCNSCQRSFCGTCVRELRVAGGPPRRFCPECGGSCDVLAPIERGKQRPKWLEKLVDVFTKPTVRR